MTIKTIPLTTPITIAATKKEIGEVRLRKPGSGDLRGLSLASVIRMDWDAIEQLASRIAVDGLAPADLASLEPYDLAQVASEVAGFFVLRPEKTGSSSPMI